MMGNTFVLPSFKQLPCREQVGYLSQQGRLSFIKMKQGFSKKLNTSPEGPVPHNKHDWSRRSEILFAPFALIL